MYEHLDEKIIKSWRIGRIIAFVIIAMVLGIGTLILKTLSVWTFIDMYVLVLEGLLVAYLFFSMIFYPIIEYKQWQYTITDDKVEFRHGIYFITTSIIPIVRIQNISISSGPINRSFGLVNLILHTASGTFHIEGLTEENALTISDNLKQRLQIRLTEQNTLKAGE